MSYLLNEQRRSPRRYEYTSPYTNPWHIARCNTPIPVKGCGYNTSRGHLPLQCSRLHLKVAKFRFVKNKASSKRLYIMSWHHLSHLPLYFPSRLKKCSTNTSKCLDTAWARVVSGAKIVKIMISCMFFVDYFHGWIKYHTLRYTKKQAKSATPCCTFTHDWALIII